MAEHELSPEQENFYQWLENLDLNTPLLEEREQLDALEAPSFEPEELEGLEALAREYAQTLFERDAVPDLPPMDLDERLLEPEVSQTIEQDLDRDR